MSRPIVNHMGYHIVLAATLAGAVIAAHPGRATAQRRNIDLQIRENRDRLESIREERESLENELSSLRNRARDMTTELQNLDQQRTATVRLVHELDRQISGLTTQLDTITFEFILAEDALTEKEAVLTRRITEIYKRGRLWTFQVLLAAESFGDLLSRYKYLYLVTRQDRRIVEDIRHLQVQISGQRRDLLEIRSEVDTQRRQRDSELRQFALLEQQTRRTLAGMQRSEQEAATRLRSLQADEERINTSIASLERARRASGDLNAPTMSATDMGTLPWPVEGEVIYGIGTERFVDGTRLVNSGIGIRAPSGTPVRAVRSGEVVWAAPYGTYGPSVWIRHGGGYYTLYLYLSRIAVRQNQQVTDGEIVGLSGGENSDHGAHVEFQLRQTPPNADTPIPLDPMDWLVPVRR
jgi:septal ring factor EnvC (AmiA/AmiB activator)